MQPICKDEADRRERWLSSAKMIDKTIQNTPSSAWIFAPRTFFNI